MTHSDSIKYHIIDINIHMINMKLLSILGATTMILSTLLGTSNVFAQVPALETEEKPALPVAPEDQPTPAKEEPTKETDDEPNTSFGKVTIPVSSREQIILEIPLKDGNSYKLLPIK